MSKILSYFFYEASCRRLLAILTETIDDARSHREEHKREGKPENESESRRIESLLKAAKAVDEECRKLAYWSDVRELARDGNIKEREPAIEKGPERSLSPIDVFEENSAPIIADVFDPDTEESSKETTQQQTQDAEAQDADDDQIFEDAQSSIHSQDDDEPRGQSSGHLDRLQTTEDNDDDEEAIVEIEPVPTDVVLDE